MLRERQHVLVLPGDVVRELHDERAHRRDQSVPAVQHTEADGAMVDGDDARRERGSEALGVGGAVVVRRDRARRAGGARSCGPLGEQLGMTLVQADDGVAEAIRSEHLLAERQSVRIGLQQRDRFTLVRTDVEARAGACRRRHPPPTQHQRVAECR